MASERDKKRRTNSVHGKKQPATSSRRGAPPAQKSGSVRSDQQKRSDRSRSKEHPPRAHRAPSDTTHRSPTAGRTASVSRRSEPRTVPRQQRPGRSTAARQQNNRRPALRRQGKLRPLAKIVIVVLAAILLVRVLPFGDRSREAAPTVGEAVREVKSGFVGNKDDSSEDVSVVSDSAILINADNGDVLYEKEPDLQRAPASLTKVMTVYVAIKNTDDLDRTLQMPRAASDTLGGEVSKSGLSAGETVTVRDLLYAAMLASGGDAANALALAVAGNEQSFVSMMNQEAEAMGLVSTHFENPIGLDADGQVSTCRDMARLLKTAMGNSAFREIITSRSYTTTANDVHPKGLVIKHTIDEYLTYFQRYFDASGYEIVGGKTGYTTDAGHCLASVAKKENAPTCIAVTMHATDASDNYYQSVKDAVVLYDLIYGK